MKRVLAVGYTQTGQLRRALDSLLGGLDPDQVEVHVEDLRPRPEYPFPWPFYRFLDAFPESVLGVPPELEKPGFDPGRESWVLLPITAACALAASSYGLLVATLTRTPEQAAAFGATSVVILSVVSGIMVPHFMMPEALQKVALASPLYWGQKAYLDALLHGAGLAEVSTSLLALVGFAGLCLTIAAGRLVR